LSLMGRVYYDFGSCPVDMEEMPSIGLFWRCPSENDDGRARAAFNFCSIPFFCFFLKEDMVMLVIPFV
jgi:hypothetical protein